ncbi:pyruvate kinase [Tumidithrix helvetica PCC 7403]|uniref:pyruvate kinase n=1 Tax=Tumidithrix helvetica TaxID=3457545 RepID=UPI003CBC67D0
MSPLPHRTKVVATIGPASNSREVIYQLIQAGMVVARLNFSHGSYEDHANTVKLLREVSKELNVPVSLLQDLQGPKVRVGQLPDGAIALQDGDAISLVPIADFNNQPLTIPIDYPHLAEEAQTGTRILLDDGLLEFTVTEISESVVKCLVVRGGLLKSRKGVNLPSLNLRLPSMTEKDIQDLDFGLTQGVDWISLSFVRQAEDIRTLKALLKQKGADTPVIAKIEKPQAIEHLDEILDECDGVMVARGDLGVEVNPERVPLLQKRIIRACNLRGIPVITATQMLDSMIQNPRPTRAEASDVANAIIDGTDAVMLSGESAVGAFPVQSVEMLVRIAAEVEPTLDFSNLPPYEINETHAISEALNAIARILTLKCIVALTNTSYTARLAAAERPQQPIIAITPNQKTYQRLNLIWGVLPLLLPATYDSIEAQIDLVEALLLSKNLVKPDDTILILGGIPLKQTGGTNLLKIHRIKSDGNFS